jgi:serine/threonine-protein kinase HipA
MSAPGALPRTLTVLLEGRVAATLTRGAPRSALSLTYDEGWRHDRGAYPLSLSMPLAGAAYEGTRVEYYLRGLLSDDPARLQRIAAQHAVSPNDPFALLAYIGEDCPGAVQFVRPDRVAHLQRGTGGRVAWLSDLELADQLRSLAAENGGGLPFVDGGHFSLPGALAKVALRWDAAKSRWGRPVGRSASTHIIKPPRAGIPFQCENEHLCLALARELGLEAAHSEILRVEDETALVVTRYDRVVKGSTVRRVHQEDFSQALGADPDLKYAAQGAPTLAAMTGILLDWTRGGTAEALRLVEGVAFNWAIAGTDAHPRNYSVLIRPETAVSLAPMYDLASALFLQTRQSRRPARADEQRLAMAVNGETRIDAIGPAGWEREATRCGLRPRHVLETIASLLKRLPDAATRVSARARAEHIDEAFAARFAREIGDLARRRLSQFARTR